MSRIGDAAHAATMNRTVLTTQARLRNLEESIASGKTAQRYDEIARDTPLLLRTEEQRSLSKVFGEVAQNGVSRLRIVDGAFESVQDVAERFRTLLTQRLGGSLGESVPLAQEADAALSQIQSALNIRFNGDYVFGGSVTTTPPVNIPDPPPVTADSTSYFNGDEVPFVVRTDIDASMSFSMHASDPAFAELIGALGAAKNAQAANDKAGLESALEALSSAINMVADLRGENGSAMKELDDTFARHETSELYYQEVISRIEDTDLADAVTSIARDQTALEAAYLVMSRLQQLSLADYLR